MGETLSLHDVRDALAQPGCAICRLKTDAAERFLESLLWESVNDPGTRDDIRRALGFCHRHTWMLARNDASLGVAIITRDVLQSLLDTLEDARFQSLPPFSLRRVQERLDRKQPATATSELVTRLDPQEKCPACVQAETMEDIYLSVLLENLLGEGGLLNAYEESHGLCLPHFRHTLTRVRGEAVFDALVNAQRFVWERLTGHLSEAIRKNDYRFRDEVRGEESGSWLRALAALAGAR